jgi:glycosyltransferase involved in cell wall biosynthesis
MKPVVLSTHNVEIDTRLSNAGAAGISIERSRLLARVRRVEEEGLARADLVLAVSTADRNAFVERFGVPSDRVVEVPNGSDTEELAPVEPGSRPERRRRLGLPERPTAIYVAAGPKIPDRFGLEWFERTARLLPDVTFLVVGGIVARPRVDGNVVATGFVEDVRPYLEAADLAVAPIQYGGGTKIKVWDTLAAGLPTVVFAETVNGMELVDSEHVLVAAKDDAALAGAVRQLLGEPALAARLAAAGRAFVVARHDWRRSAENLDAALTELAARR